MRATVLISIILFIYAENIGVDAILDNCANCFPFTFSSTMCTIPTCSGSSSLPTSVNSNDLAASMAVPGPVTRGSCFPPWIDVAKFKKGQNFFANHYGAFGLTEFFTLIGLLAIPQMTDVLLFTAENDCPVAASRRYVTTTENIILWGQADISLMENPYILIRSLDKVRYTHQVAADRVRRVGNLGNAERFKDVTVKDVFWDAFHADIAASYGQPDFPSSYTNALNSYIHLNQFQYAMTQWSFSSMATIARDLALVPLATDADIVAFNHFWAVVTHMKGVSDTYNIALRSTTAEGLRQHYNDILVNYIIPALYRIGHLAKYFVELSLERSASVPIVLNGVTFPSPLRVDAILLGTLRVVLNITNIENTQLYSVASTEGRFFIDTVSEVIASKGAIQPVIDAGLNTAAEAGMTLWGNRDFGACYNLWITKCQKANNLHYTYTGPDVNPKGEKSDCSIYSNILTC